VAGIADLGPHHPAVWADRGPERVAAVLHAGIPGGGTVATITYAELAERSAQLVRALHRRGLGAGDHLAIMCTNRIEMLVTCWAALRSGMYCTPISTWLTAHECTYIATDSGAKALVAAAELGDVARDVADRAGITVRVAVGGAIAGFEPWYGVLAAESGDLLDDEPEGSVMFYSSGTTGRPKGVRKPLSGRVAGSSNPLAAFVPLTGLGEDTVYLSPAPLYHAAPLGWSLGTLRMGGTVVLLPGFEPELVLATIAEQQVTLAQFVPTMLTRLLRLDRATRDKYDRSSLRVVLHAAAPCPRHVKAAAIEWLGPIVHEYYSGTEGSGITYITSEDWLDHPGSVGRPLVGDLHITDESGTAVGPGTEGTIWFGGGERYEYHGDPGATAARRHSNGWTTLDDVGYVDADGYLYLTDRRAHMIVSGGVNISPREIEDVLSTHPAVDDVAVLGVPHEEHGEAVKAVVTLVAGNATAGPDLADELIAHCRGALAGYKCPRSIDFVDELPRLPTGKLATRLLRDRYWHGHETRIV